MADEVEEKEGAGPKGSAKAKESATPTDNVKPIDRVRERAVEGLETARGKIQEVGKDLGVRAQQVAEEARREAQRVSERAREQYGVAVEQLRDGYTRVRKDVGELSEDVTDYVRDNPGRSVLIAAGAGFLIGLLARGRRRDI